MKDFTGNNNQSRRIIQVAHLVQNLDVAMERYVRILGIEPWSVYTFEAPKLRECTYREKPSDAAWRLALSWVGNVQLELIENLRGETVYTAFLKNKGEGLHHIKEWVDDCEAALEHYCSKGIGVIQSGKFEDDEFYYLDVESELGIIYEIGNNGNIGAAERIYGKS